MKIFHMLLLLIVTGLLFLAGCNCGRAKTPEPATDSAATVAVVEPAAAEVVVLEGTEESDLQKLETAAPAYHPVTKDNYQQELASLEAEVKADLQ